MRAGRGPGDGGRPVLLVAALRLRSETPSALCRMELFPLLQERDLRASPASLRGTRWHRCPLCSYTKGPLGCPVSAQTRGSRGLRGGLRCRNRAASRVPSRRSPRRSPRCPPGLPGGLCSGALSRSCVPTPCGPTAGSHLPARGSRSPGLPVAEAPVQEVRGWVRWASGRASAHVYTVFKQVR